MAVGRHYESDLGREYFAYQQRSGHAGAALERRKFAPHVRPSDTVVDFGCGGGYLLRELPGAVKVGVEVNPAAREAARAIGVEVVEASSELGEALADVVITNHALEHTLAPAAELAELLRVLRPGGLIVVWLPLDDWRTQRRARSEPNHHLYGWTPLLLGNLLDEVGFRVERCQVVCHAWPPGYVRLARLPAPLFDLLAHAFSVLRRRRQIMAIARKPT